MKPSPAFSALAVLCFCSAAIADSVKLKSGETIEGEITAEDAGSITIVFEASRGIKDERTIGRDEILSVAKDDPAEKNWQKVLRDHPTADLLTPADYDKLIAKADGFLQIHNRGAFAAKARQLIESLRAEKSRVTNGDLKLNGQWITAANYQKEKFWIDGTIALRRMNQAAQANRFTDALRQFEKIEADYGGTTIHAKGIAIVVPLLKRYAGVINEAIITQPLLVKQRADRLNTLSDNDRKITEQAQAEDDAAFLVKIEEERKSGTKWLSLSPFNLEELQKALQTVELESKRLGELDMSNAETQEILLRQIDQAIGEGRLAAANTLLNQASSSLKNSPYVKALQERVKNEITRIADEKKSADEAMKEAARLAKERSPKPEKPRDTSSDEPDPVAEGASPLAKAVLDSRIGKASGAKDSGPEAATPAPAGNSNDSAKTTPVEKDAPKPAPAKNEPAAAPKEKDSPPAAGSTPPPAAPPADTAKTSGPEANPPAAESQTARPTSPAAPRPADKPSTNTNDPDSETPAKTPSKPNPLVTQALYALAALLTVTLVGLLLAPIIQRRKANRNSEEETEEQPEAEQEESPDEAPGEEIPDDNSSGQQPRA